MATLSKLVPCPTCGAVMRPTRWLRDALPPLEGYRCKACKINLVGRGEGVCLTPSLPLEQAPCSGVLPGEQVSVDATSSTGSAPPLKVVLSV